MSSSSPLVRYQAAFAAALSRSRTGEELKALLLADAALADWAGYIQSMQTDALDVAVRLMEKWGPRAGTAGAGGATR